MTAIAARLSDYYARQLAWLDDSIAALDAVLGSSAEPDYDRWTEEDAQRARRLGELAAEFNALKKEWDGTPGISPADREHVRALAQQFDARAAEFDARRKTVTERLAVSIELLRGESGTLRRGRENARKYGTDDASGGGIVDSRA